MGIAWLAGAILVSTAANAQQRAQSVPQKNQAYDVSRETVLEGKVIQYTQASTVAPLGPHVTMQTASGVVDVHLGNARMLEANHFTLASGESVRIVGENVAYGTGAQFLARVLQKGKQTLAIRSTRGFPLAPSGNPGQRTPGGAL
jgi:DNA/RNA endonuclease YhcR with UshA esterase domain